MLQSKIVIIKNSAKPFKVLHKLYHKLKELLKQFLHSRNAKDLINNESIIV